MTPEAVFDAARAARTGLPEAIFCQGKTASQIADIIGSARSSLPSLLMTRLDKETFDRLPAEIRARIDYDPISRTGLYGEIHRPAGSAEVAVVTAGTTDVAVAKEAVRTFGHAGIPVHEIYDVGVAGLWRLLDRIPELSRFPVVVMIAGMDGAIFSVLGGLVPGAVIAVPTSTGYGVSHQGETALHSALASCAPGITVVNIDNGYGAACAAIRILRARDRNASAP